LLRWTIFDGWGFYDAFSLWHRRFDEAWPESYEREGYIQRARMQGVGRCIWFVEGGIAAGIARRIATFEAANRADLWSGIGFAACYACGVGPDGLRQLRNVAGSYWAHLAEGAACAATCAQKDGSLSPSHELACRALTGLTLDQATQVVHACWLSATRGTDGQNAAMSPEHESWRRLIQQHLLKSTTENTEDSGEGELPKTA
jgi:hypothetical protein